MNILFIKGKVYKMAYSQFTEINETSLKSALVDLAFSKNFHFLGHKKYD